ncbi:MAG: GP88 family protein [Fusobacteriaceae bacterium]
MNFKKLILEGLTTNHTAKMEGMVSFSTDTTTNKFCESMSKCTGSICEKCFARTMHKRLPSFSVKISRNEWVKNVVLNKCDIPFLNVAYFRLEAFGELENMIQLENYIKMAKFNSHANFALWTKRVDLLEKLEIKKPKNLNIIVSSPMINKQVALSETVEKMVDGIFTVYDKVQSETVKINCGENKCIECLKCYKKSAKMKIINEVLK